jgi:hypothetical protein
VSDHGGPDDPKLWPFECQLRKKDLGMFHAFIFVLLLSQISKVSILKLVQRKENLSHFLASDKHLGTECLGAVPS